MLDSTSTRHPLAAIQAELPVALPNDLIAALAIVRPIVTSHGCALIWTTGHLEAGGEAMVGAELWTGDGKADDCWTSWVKRGVDEEESRLLAMCYLLGTTITDQPTVAVGAIPAEEAATQADRLLAKLRATTSEEALTVWHQAAFAAIKVIKDSNDDAYHRLVIGYQEHRQSLREERQEGMHDG